MMQADSLKTPSRRALLRAGIGATALVLPPPAHAAPAGFDQWRDGFRSRALAKGISEAMNCTAFGLMVAIPFLLIHAFLQTRTNDLVDSLEMACMKLVNARSAANRGNR